MTWRRRRGDAQEHWLDIHVGAMILLQTQSLTRSLRWVWLKNGTHTYSFLPFFRPTMLSVAWPAV